MKAWIYLPLEKMSGYKHRAVQNRVSVATKGLRVADFVTIMSLVNNIV